MSYLALANEGVFPITKDKDGQPLSELPATGFSFPGTIQGEGKLAGVPSLFIRLSGCNLRCIWSMPDGSFCRCDTPYASFAPERTFSMAIDDVIALVQQNLGAMKHVVITGGEPFLQHKALADLCLELKKIPQLHLSVETNGTLFSREVAQHIDLFSISPKLSNSNPTDEKITYYGLKPSGPLSYHAQRRKNLPVLQKFIDFSRENNKDFQLKFVIGNHNDYLEINKEYLSELKNWNADDILLMPLGATMEELKKTSKMVLEMAIQNGWRYAPRVHIELFGSIAGV